MFDLKILLILHYCWYIASLQYACMLFSETGCKWYANYQTYNAHRSPITFCPPGAACFGQGSSIGKMNVYKSISVT